MQQATLFDLPARELMERFGAGNATPGSGCAAALMALLAAKLVASVAKMTVARGRSSEVRDRAGIIVRVLDERVAPRLQELFEEDARVFEAVIDARKRRDRSVEPS